LELERQTQSGAELATEPQFKTPPENTQRDVFVYTGIDADAMRADWWRVAGAAWKK
jgi:hypothetical protein